jgi:hypothetical protein
MTWCPDAPAFVVPPLGWGSALATRYDPDYGREVITPCSKLIVHHSASNQPAPGDEDDFTRQIEAYGESRDGAAVEYHYLIYPTGVCHGGFGDTRGCHSAQLDPAAGVNYNSTAIGVCFVGYFHPPYDHQPTAEAVATFQAWLEWMTGSGRLTADVLEPASSSGAAGWYGHRDVFATACPGDVLYPQLPDLIRLPSTPATPPDQGDEMTDADWARMTELVHTTVLGVVRSDEFATRVYDPARTADHDATLGIVRGEEFAAIIHTNTA